MKRADKLLFDQGLFESRKKAQIAIENQRVWHVRKKQETPIEKPSQHVDWQDGDSWKILSDPELKYVSRAGAKLQAALDEWDFSVKDLVVLDVGLSTGGFSDCLLQNGAKFIVGVDVGQGQLHPRLKMNPKLLSLEKVNAKHPLLLDRQIEFDLMVFDVSFISVLPVLKAQAGLLKKGGRAIVLFKPQFEVGRGHHNKKGLVSDEEGLRVLQKTVTTMAEAGWEIQSTTPSVIRGEDGNQEYFIKMQKL